MTEEEAAELRRRVDELEQSNEALWAWIKTLVGQDALILETAIRLTDKDKDWMSRKDKIINQVANNAIYIRNSELENSDE